ncbi:MAG: HEAT repeat domain-containing protein [Rubripirellula sp.]
MSSQISRFFVLALLTISLVHPLVGSERQARATMAGYRLWMHERPERTRVEFGRIFPNGLKELWLKGMGQKDPEFRRMLVDSLTIAHRRGMKDTHKIQARLLTLLRDPDPNLDVTRAVTGAMVAMDAKEYADRLARMTREHGPIISEIVEPALARWRSPALKDVWVQRVLNAGEGETMMILAINGLSALPDEPDIDRAASAMKAIVRSNSQPVAVRLAAAKAVGNIGTYQMMQFVDEVASMETSPSELSSIMAIDLIGDHDDEDATDRLTGMLNQDSPVIQSRALEKLFRIDPKLVEVHADRFLASPDANVRTWSARGMIEEASWERVGQLGAMLNDVNPSLRREVAAALLRIAETQSLRERMISVVTSILNEDQWQGCEQATVILANLDYEPAGPRFVELLSHPRAEVRVAAACGLKQMQIGKLLPDMLEFSQSVYQRYSTGELDDSTPGWSLTNAHLFEAFGDQEYQPAANLLKKYLKKNFTLGEYARPAAAWALGLLTPNQPKNEVAPMLLERLKDIEGLVLETEMMREMCAISLGRMKAEIALGDLRKFAELKTATGVACYWAIEHMTGRKPPDLDPPRTRYEDWFLMPLKKQR